MNAAYVKIQEVTLTDRSTVFNVVLLDEDKQTLATIPALDERHADLLLQSIAYNSLVEVL